MQRMCIKVHKSVQFSAHFVNTHNREDHQMTTKLVVCAMRKLARPSKQI